MPKFSRIALAGLLFTTSIGYAATTATVDIPKLAKDFSAKIEMVDLGVCTPKPVSGTRHVCAAVPVKGAGLTPSPVICDSELAACYLGVSLPDATQTNATTGASGTTN